MFLDIDEDVRRDLEIVDGYVVPREQRSRDHQNVSTRLSLALETAAVQQMRKAGGAECYETNTEKAFPEQLSGQRIRQPTGPLQLGQEIWPLRRPGRGVPVGAPVH